MLNTNLKGLLLLRFDLFPSRKDNEFWMFKTIIYFGCEYWGELKNISSWCLHYYNL